jgi:hypothetical protein
VIIYLFTWLDVFVYSAGTSGGADVMSSYRPLAISRGLHLQAAVAATCALAAWANPYGGWTGPTARC